MSQGQVPVDPSVIGKIIGTKGATVKGLKSKVRSHDGARLALAATTRSRGTAHGRLPQRTNGQPAQARGWRQRSAHRRRLEALREARAPQPGAAGRAWLAARQPAGRLVDVVPVPG